MATLLVVDDVALDRHLAGALLEEQADWTAIYAEDGREALLRIQEAAPDLVLTDLQMPEMNGLELVQAISRDYSYVPVIFMTAHGSEEIAVAALKAGAASYVPKRDLARDLVATTQKVLHIARAQRTQKQALECLQEMEFRFVLSNDSLHLTPLIAHVQDHMTLMNLVDKADLNRVGAALHECLINAMEHGNLELTSELRETGPGNAYQRLVDKRRLEMPYRDRRVVVVARFSRDQAAFVVRDDGPGFRPDDLPDPTDPANLERPSGRGLFLIRTFMDEVSFNPTGNEITMVKRRK